MVQITACRGDEKCYLHTLFLCSFAVANGAFYFVQNTLGGIQLANANILEQKKALVAELAERMKNAKGGVIVNYQGIPVADDTKLRSELRAAGVEYTVVKNTLTSKACDMIGFEGLKDQLTGMTALATCESDPIAPAKILNAYAKDHENFVLKAGFVDGELLDAAGVKELADTPSKEVLIGRLMGSLQSGLYGFAYAIQAIIDKAEGGEAAAE
jgi:large subunit ribosomal protein L10